MLLLSLLLAGAAPADDQATINCANQQSQLEMNVCSGREYKAADILLNNQWRVAQRTAREYDAISPPLQKSEAHSAQLLAAQRAWIVFRDAHCLALSDKYRGGTIRGLIQDNCLTELTKIRTKQLREYSETN